MTDYQFKTIWKFKAPLEQVWEIIRCMDKWPEWWTYVSQVELLQKGDANDIGSVRRIYWKTALPYTITFDSELLEMDKYRHMEGRAFGELEGKGIWHFSYENGVTTVQYDWLVNTTKAWMNLLAPIARPIFAWNHDKVMAAGFEGLKKRLDSVELAV
ncbi:MAG: SRPBCC family protein [Saprospiraceae bacterium]|nr:SRPBCC family protein [Saprospiraceae bacterium]